MDAQPSLDGPLAKLGRARHHLKTLYDDYNRSVGPTTHSLIQEEGDEPGTYVFRIDGLPAPPADWGLIVGDFAHNLRSSLDHLVWQLVRLNRKKPNGGNQFPICSSRTRYWEPPKPGQPSVRDRMLRGVSEEDRAPIDAVQPYPRTDNPHADLFAGLNDLSNFDKHRVIQAAFAGTLQPTQEDFDVVSTHDGAMVAFETTLGEPLVDGAEVMRARIHRPHPDAKVQMQANLPIAIGFGETRIQISGLGMIYEVVRDFIKSYAPRFSAKP